MSWPEAVEGWDKPRGKASLAARGVGVLHSSVDLWER